MNRRDVLIFLGIVIFAVMFYLVLPIPATSVGIIKHFAIGFASLDVYMILLMILSSTIRKFGDWGDKKLFRHDKENCC